MEKQELVSSEDKRTELKLAGELGAKDAEIARLLGELASAREEGSTTGILRKIAYDQAHNEMIKYAVLLRLRESKEYRKFGRNWPDFCEQVVGEPRRTVDLKIADIRPLANQYGQRFTELAGIEWRQIRLLGRSVGQDVAEIDDGHLVFDDERIPIDVDHAEELQTAIEKIIEKAGALAAQVKRLEKKKNEIVAEETKGLKAEVKALVNEIERMKVFDPKDRDREWSVEQMRVIHTAAETLAQMVEKFVLDPRVEEDPHLQAQIYALLTEGSARLRDLRQRIDVEFGLFED